MCADVHNCHTFHVMNVVISQIWNVSKLHTLVSIHLINAHTSTMWKHLRMYVNVCAVYFLFSYIRKCKIHM